MKIMLLSALVLMASVFFVFQSASAQDPLNQSCEGAAASSPICAGRNSGGADPIAGSSGVLGRVVNLISFIVGVATVIMVMIGGIKMVTSAGDANKFKSGRETALYALIGLVVVISARAIIQFVLNRL